MKSAKCDENVVDKKIRLVQAGYDTRYEVRWYAFGAVEVLEPSEPLPRQFIDRFWKRVKRQQ